MPLISIQNITKKYHTFNSDWDRFVEAITNGKIKRRHEHWILKGISLEAEPENRSASSATTVRAKARC